MSSVRMCDTCGRIFSENEDNWATGSIQQMKRGPDGIMRPVPVQQDACPQCNPAGQPVNMRPRIDMGQPPPRQLDRGPYDATIARLEHELGMDKPPE